MIKPIEIDLRRDLPKVREQWEVVISQRGQCLYALPCIIGAMVPKSRRARLDKEIASGVGSPNVYTLIDGGRIVCPDEQREDIISLQEEFDGETADMEPIIARLEAKYPPPDTKKSKALGNVA